MKESNFRKRYLVLLADRARAKFFTIYLGGFEDVSGFVDKDVPQKIKADNGRPGKIDRHIRDHLYHHLKNVGLKVFEYLVKQRIKQLDGIFVGGHKELLEDIKRFLPNRLKNKVMGKFVTGLNKPVGDLANEVIVKFDL